MNTTYNVINIMEKKINDNDLKEIINKKLFKIIQLIELSYK